MQVRHASIFVQSVVALHTDGEYKGMLQPVGTVDFMVNGGGSQPPPLCRKAWEARSYVRRTQPFPPYHCGKPN